MSLGSCAFIECARLISKYEKKNYREITQFVIHPEDNLLMVKEQDVLQ